MPRPIKLRQVTSVPAVRLFKPAGIPAAALDMVTLSLEEIESIRLKDMESLHQEDCATRMQVSRATFHTILKSARQKIAEALLNGKAIQVEGGLFALPGGRFRCRRDGSEWDLPPGPLPGARSVSCPTCRGTEVQPVPMSYGPRGRTGGRGRRGYGWQGSWGPIGPRVRTDPPGIRGTRATQATKASREISENTDVVPQQRMDTDARHPRGEGE